jgi:serine/threonine protein kinase
MNSQAEIFIDEFGNIHEKDAELGRGGQGAVFRTRDPDVAIKLALDANGLPMGSGVLGDRLRAVRLLPVPRNLNLSMPAAILRDRAGYAMRLLNDMLPFKHFWPGGAGGASNGTPDIPGWLAGAPEGVAQELIHYVETGGLRRRLLALYKCSVVLERLHAAGLVYGDVSPANAYISKNHGSRAVWMIDADNLRFETEGKGQGVYTPGFGAPELVQGIDGGRPRTDCHAFAVMAFWMLTLQHPFVGDYVENGPSADWADDDADQRDLTEKAYAGIVPWIDDEDDDSNATAKGLPRALVLTEELRTLFQETFGPGRVHPWRRPVIFHWPYFLAKALDSAIPCPACRMSYHDDWDNSQQKCPYCGTGRPAVLRATDLKIGDSGQRIPRWTWSQHLYERQGEAFRVPHRLFYPFSIADGDRDVLEITTRKDAVLLKRPDHLGPQELTISVGGSGHGEFINLTTSITLPETVGTQGFTVRVDDNPSHQVGFKFEEAVP